jgi:hypothetical protein
MGNWRKNLERFDHMKADRWMAKNSGKVDINQRIGARYVPNIETTKLNDEIYPGGFLTMRILPGIVSNPCPSWIFTVQSYFLRDFFDVLKRSDIPESHLEVFTDKIHSPATIDPAKEREDPINALRRAAYEDNSQHCRDWAKKLFTRPNHYMNVILRMIPLMNEKDKFADYRNVGPRVFRLPQKPVELIMRAFKDPEIGDPTNPDEAYDFKYWMEYRKVKINDKEMSMPQYDNCCFSRKLTPAGSEEELDMWMSSLPNLHDEYVETPLKDMVQIADLCEMVIFNRIKTIHPLNGNKDNRPSEETEDIELSDSYGRSRDGSKESDNDEAPRSRRSKPEPEEEDEAPRSRRSKPELEEEDEERPSKSRARARVVEDDAVDDWLDKKLREM